MAEPSPNFYPEELPDLARLEDAAATTLTLDVLRSLAEEYALNGEREVNTNVPLAFQNDTYLADGRRVWAAKYYAYDGTERLPGEKALDILLLNNRPAFTKVHGMPVEQKYNFTNIYFVNNGLDQNGLQLYRIERHQFSCPFSLLELLLRDNHLEDDPDYIQEKEQGLHIVSEVEAFNLASMLAKYLKSQHQSS